jgi:hypothetical protein
MTAQFAPAEGRAVWYGPQIDYRAEGMHVLSAGEIAEIDAALAHLLSFGPVDFPGITPDMFPLPNLGKFFRGLGRELLHGRGFLLLRGLPRERYSLDDIGFIYYGLGVHLGRPVAQSYQGELLGNVIDVSDVEVQARGYHAGGGQRMHSDNCDVVSLIACGRRTPAASAASSARPPSITGCSKHDRTCWRRSTTNGCSGAWSSTRSTAPAR